MEPTQKEKRMIYNGIIEERNLFEEWEEDRKKLGCKKGFEKIIQEYYNLQHKLEENGYHKLEEEK